MQNSEIESAHALENSADFVGALRLYYAAYKRDSSDSDAVLGIAQNAMTLDNPELALEFFVKLLILDHRNPWGFLGRAQVMIRYNQVNRAVSDIQRAIDLDQPASDLRVDCAAALNDCGECESALEALAPIREDYGEDSDFCAEWIFASIASGKGNDEISRMLDDCMKNSDDPLFELCYLALHRSDDDRAPVAQILENAPELEYRANLLFGTSIVTDMT